MKSFKIFLLILVAVSAGIAIGAGLFWTLRGEGEIVSQTEDDADQSVSDDAPIAFFYQNVGAFTNGVGLNQVRTGSSTDGVTVESFDFDALNWKIGKDGNEGYGDPVFSYLENGHWAMTAWSTPTDPRGAGGLMYHESSCPVINEDAVVVLNASEAEGCLSVRGTSMGKSSQVFSSGGENYVFHTIQGSVYLARLTEGSRGPGDLDALCVLPNPAGSLDALAFGETTQVLDGRAEGFRLSDTAIAQREDGTWVLFVKGIESSSTCAGGSLCELCSRSIYRTTSTDLITWSALEEVVQQASVPEAVTMPDGTVRLYWQDFSDACDADNLSLANIAPISTAEEDPKTYALGATTQVKIPDEPFETNKKIHYATNGNPILLPDEDAFEALLACVE